jgi:tRNA(Ile)-lysidine synthase
MDDLTRTVLNTIRQHEMFEPGDSVVVAVSGGPDSVCMLRVLDELSGALSLQLVVAHVDHVTRNGESHRDAAFVERLADSMGLECHIETIDVAGSKPPGVSFEIAARRARYEFLENLARNTRSSKIAVGHTANDQAETMLMRLMAGTGRRGIAGMRPVRPLGDVVVVRPLIDVKRTEIMGYLESRKITFQIDRTNLDRRYNRNKVRLDLIPTLEREYNPNVADALCRAARLLQEEEDYLSACARETAAQVVLHEDTSAIAMSRPAYSAASPVLRRRLLIDLVRKVSEATARPTLESIESADRLCVDGRTGSRMVVCKDVEVAVEADRLLVRKLRSCYSEPRTASVTDVSLPGRAVVEELGVEVETILVQRTQSIEELIARCGPERQLFDADTVEGDLHIRAPLPGDSFYPLGLGGRKKLSDYFTDEKVPRDRRRRTALLLSGDDIMWVAGGAMDDRFKLTDATRTVLEVRCAPVG